MKQKKYLFIAAAAALFAACSSDDATTEQVKQQAPQALGFSAYVNRTTRAGDINPIPDAATLQTTKGFGVFAYYTNNEAYDQIFTPNFMYNQGVTFGTAWTYNPVKYWPNEYSTAIADENDKISFFAYAPYVKSSATGKPVQADGTTPDDATKGIAGFSRNTATGDPLVKYIASGNIGDQVDLLWGVCGTTGSWPSKGGTQGTLGLPWLNVQHPNNMTTGAGSQQLAFNFLHALAGLRVTVDTSVDVATPSAESPDAAETKVFIRSIKFTGMTAKGTLNLNNTVASTAVWLDFAGINDMESGQSITWFDGRKDGAEGTTIASNEKVNFLNPNFVQSTVWDAAADPGPALSAGVTGTPANLFGSKVGDAAITPATDAQYVYVIPTGESVTCTIEYDVLTRDDMLPGFLNDNKVHGSVVKNVITKEIKVGTGSSATAMTLANGKQYTINLHLGLKSVTFDATVAGWDTGTTGSGELPANP